MKKEKMGRKQFSIKAAAEGKVTAVFATLNVKDHDGDVTRPGAFGEQETRILPTHNYWHIPLGKGITRESGNEAIGELQFNLDIQAGADWFKAIEFDLKTGSQALQEWSYTYDPIEYNFGEFEGAKVRFLEKIKVHEISPVFQGAGIGTTTRAAKSAQSLEEQFMELESALAAFSSFGARLKSLADLRAKDGRTLSEVNTSRISTILEANGTLEAELKAILAEDPAAEETNGAALFLDFQNRRLEINQILRGEQSNAR